MSKVNWHPTGNCVTIELGDSDSIESVCVTLVNRETGRKARAWLGCVIRPNGRPEFTLSTLGKTKGSDRNRRAQGAWHDDLH